MNSSKNLFLIPIAVILAAGIAACAQNTAGSAAQAQSPVKGTLITASSNGKTVNVHVGDEITVELRANPTTGYDWQLKPLNSKVAVQVGERVYKSSDPSGKLVGAGGQEFYHFRVQAAGSVTLHLENARPWEKGKPPAETFEVTLQAK